jgi:hypothetical protein
MRRWCIVLLLLLASVSSAAAQNFAPQPPQRPRSPGAPQANICSTDYGWCPIQQVATPGGSCYCFVPPSSWLPGLARFWPYQGPVSPYLNPHETPPSTIR